MAAPGAYRPTMWMPSTCLLRVPLLHQYTDQHTYCDEYFYTDEYTHINYYINRDHNRHSWPFSHTNIYANRYADTNCYSDYYPHYNEHARFVGPDFSRMVLKSGNLLAWTSSTADLGDLSVSNAAALTGSQGMQAVIDDANTIYRHR